MADHRSNVAGGEDLLGFQRLIGAGPVEQVGHQHHIAVVGQPLAHLEDSRPDTEAVHVEDHRRVLPGSWRGEHVRRALAVTSTDRDLFFAHSWSPPAWNHHDHAGRGDGRGPRSRTRPARSVCGRVDDLGAGVRLGDLENGAEGVAHHCPTVPVRRVEGPFQGRSPAATARARSSVRCRRRCRGARGRPRFPRCLLRAAPSLRDVHSSRSPSYPGACSEIAWLSHGDDH